jgi:hypothetical protein
LTIRALAGLVGLNVLVLAVGATILFACKGWRSWAEALGQSGIAYLLGLAALGTGSTLALVAGVPFGSPTFLATAVAIGGAGIATGIARGSERPATRVLGWHPPALSIFTAVWVAASWGAPTWCDPKQ